MIDDQSEPGSWARHLRDTEAMRGGGKSVDCFVHFDGSREARPMCDCSRYNQARSSPVLLCNGSGSDCPNRVEPTVDEPNSSQFAFGDPHWPGLAKLNEECGEVIQEIGKLMMVHGSAVHWSGDLRQRLLEEISDMQAAADFVLDHCFSAEERMLASGRRADKIAKFQHWQNNPHDDRPVAERKADA